MLLDLQDREISLILEQRETHSRVEGEIHGFFGETGSVEMRGSEY